MIWVAWELFVNLVEGALFVLFLYRSLGIRCRQKWLPAVSYLPVTVLVYVLNQSSLPFTLQLPLFTLVDMLFVICFFQGKLSARIAYGCVSLLIASVCNNLVLLMIATVSGISAFQSLTSGGDVHTLYFIAQTCYLIINIIIYAYALRIRKRGLDIPERESLLFIASFLVCILQSALVQEMSIDPLVTQHSNFVAYLMVSSSCFVFLIIWLHLISRAYSRQRLLEQDLQRIASERTHLADMQSSYFALRAWRHDYHNHLQIMKYYIEQSDVPSLTEYLGELDQQFSMLQVSVSTRNAVFNALINTKMVLALQQGIDLQVEANLPERLPIDDVSFCVLLGNLVDNALDATGRLPTGSAPWIRVTAKTFDDAVEVRITNSCDGQYRYQGARLASRKDDSNHGIGLARVKQILDSLEGELTLHPGEKVFEASVRIPIDGHKSRAKALSAL